MYEKYKKLIRLKREVNNITEEFVKKTTTQLDHYLKKKKLTKKEYDELIKMMSIND